MAETKRRAFIISDGARKLTLDIGNLGPRDSMAVRQATGFSLARLTAADNFDMDSLCVLWWLTRIKNGEQFLTFDDVLDAYKTLDAMERFEVTAVEDEIEEEDPGSPLPSGAE